MLQRKQLESQGCHLLMCAVIELNWSKASPDVVCLLCSCLKGWGEGGGALLHLVHLKGFSPASPHTHILYLCDVHASETQAEHTSARRPVGTLVNVRGPGDLSHHTSVLAVRARRCMEGFGRWKTDTVHFPVTLLERPASLERRALCLRLIPSLAANYFMLSFELSVEIQLSDCLCSLHNWGGDKGMGEEGRTEMAETRFLAVRHRGKTSKLFVCCECFSWAYLQYK